MLRIVRQALNSFWIDVTYCVIVIGTSTGKTKMSTAVRVNELVHNEFTHSKFADKTICTNCFHTKQQNIYIFIIKYTTLM